LASYNLSCIDKRFLAELMIIVFLQITHVAMLSSDSACRPQWICAVI